MINYLFIYFFTSSILQKKLEPAEFEQDSLERSKPMVLNFKVKVKKFFGNVNLYYTHDPHCKFFLVARFWTWDT